MDSAIDYRSTEANAGSPACPVAPRILSIGSADLPPKEHLLLRSLVRLLHGQYPGIELQVADDPTQCKVVFVPADWPQRLGPERVCIRVHRAPAGDAPEGGLRVEAPLRASNVGAVLRAAFDQLDASGAALDGPAALFQAVTARLLARERRATVFEYEDGRQLCVRFVEGVGLGNVPLDGLLGGDGGTVRTRRAEPYEIAAFDAAGAAPFRVRDLVWRAAFRMGPAEGAAVVADSDVLYHLTRWPDAIALAQPGVPKLAALLTGRPMSLAQAAAAAGMSAAVTRRFAEACVALGLATVVGRDGWQAEAPAAPAVANTGLLSRLRDRLKLW